MNLRIILSIAALLFVNALAAQMISGTVANEEGEYLFGATLLWKGGETGAVVDMDGTFEIAKQEDGGILVIDYVGYESIEIEVGAEEDNLEIVIGGITELMEVVVAAKIRDNYTSTLKTLNIETIGADEFRKAPCCNLAESFSTNASVDVAYSDAVTGAREIQLLGLRGTYTQMMIEKRPSMTGLGSAFAMEYIPGTWLHSIQIAKGAGSVQHGYQSMTGQINAELVKPFEDKPVFVNLYGSTFGRGEVNVHLNKEINKELSMGLLLHGSTRHNELDGNNDSFYDTPQKDMLDGMFRLFYRGDVLRFQLNAHALTDKHTAGQILPVIPKPGFPYYQIAQNNERVELFGKIGYLGFDNPNHTVGFITNASWHNLDSNYGKNIHRGEQRNVYINGMFSAYDETQKHHLNIGASYLYDDYQERLNDTDYGRTEKVPGVYLEYSFTPSVDELLVCEEEKENDEEIHENEFFKRFGVVAGLRTDFHNLFGTLITPRLNLKYNFSVDNVIRLSAGRGYRTANVIAENVGLLASNRSVVLEEDLDMEDAWTFGINHTYNFKIGEREGSLATDLYRTQFNNQVIIDRERDFQHIYFYNLKGESFSNSFLSVLSYDLLEGLEIKLAYKMNDVKISYRDEVLIQRPMVAKHKGLITLDYTTPDENWDFNSSLQIIGKQRFADLLDNPLHNGEHHVGTTPAFTQLGLQVTRKFGNFEIYLGGENLTNFIQQNPIIDAENPFGDYFDATHIYAPITGRMGYLGIRWSLDKK